MTKKPCFMTRLLAAVLAVVMLSSAVYIAVEADHDWCCQELKRDRAAPAMTAPSAARSASARIC